MNRFMEKPVNAVSLSAAAEELEIPIVEVLRVARRLKIFLAPLGPARELYMSPISLPELQKYFREKPPLAATIQERGGV